MALADLADDATLRALVGSSTFERGEQYARSHRVRELEVAANLSGLVVQATVAGSGTAVYQTVVSLRPGAAGEQPELYAACSCPVGRACKHAVASVLAAREREDRGRVPAGPSWHATLSEVLDDADPGTRPSGPGGPTTPLGLQVELTAAGPPARNARWSGSIAETRGRLRVRPVARGARGRWVRSAVTWAGLAHADHAHGRFEQQQLDVLRELLVSLRAGARLAWGSDTAERELLSFGPSVWRLLERAAETGLPLVPAGSLQGVRVADGPASLHLDLTAADGGDVLVRPGAVVGGVWTDAADIDLIGDPAHGVVVWVRGDDGPRPAWSVVLAPLDRRPTAGVQRLVARRTRLEVPAAERDDLLHDVLPRLSRVLKVGSADGSVEVPEPVVPRLALAIHWRAVDEAALAWQVRYGEGQRLVLHELGDDPVPGRDLDAEAALIDELDLDDAASALLCSETTGRSRPVPHQVLGGDEVVTLARDVLPALRRGPLELDVTGVEPDLREAPGTPEVRFAVREHDDGPTDWLDLEVVVSIGDRQIGLGTVLEAITRGQRNVVLPDGVYLDLERPELARLARLVDEAGELQDQPRDGIRVARHDASTWAELAEIGLVDEQTAAWVRAVAGLRDVESLPEVPHPAGLHAELRPYQRDGLAWLHLLWERSLGGILADDMGLGKTVQTLALVAATRATTDAPFLVVAPTSVVGAWAGEAARFTPDLVVRTVTESHARRGRTLAEVAHGADVVVTSYTLFRIEAAEYDRVTWAGAVLDEAQAVKNHQGKTYQAARRLRAPFKLAISGTPMENDLMELWSLLSITAPGLYPHPGRFADAVAKPIEKGHDTEALEALRRRVRPLVLRRTKALVASELPPKQEQVLEVVLSPRHRRLYDTHLQRERQKVLGLVEDLDQHRMAIFSSLTRLRQLSLDAALVDPAHEGVGSAKIDVLVEHLAELAEEGHRALVFSQFTGFLRRVRDRLDAVGIAHAYLDGTTRDRDAVVRGFREGDAPVFLISLKAGGVGLTLTEADYCFVLDPWWNPAVENQAVDRAHRIGQQRPVHVYRLVSVGTIEEKVMELKERKAALFASVLDGGAAVSSRLTAEDVAGLFGA